MTDEEALKRYQEMEEYFGTLPNFEHHPKQFAYYARLYEYYTQRQAKGTL